MPAMHAIIVAFPLDDRDRRPAVAGPVVIAVDGAGDWRIAPDGDQPGAVPVALGGGADSRTADTRRALCAALGID